MTKRTFWILAAILVIAILGCGCEAKKDNLEISERIVNIPQLAWVHQFNHSNHVYLIQSRGGLIHAEHCQCKKP